MATRMTKRQDDRYAATARVDGKRLFGYGKTQAAARADLAEKVKRAEAGAPVRDSSRTVSDWLTEWRTTMLEASNRATATKTLYAGLTKRHVDPVIGSVPLAKLRPADITKLILTMQANGSASSTIRNAYAALRGALDDAVRNDLIAANPAVKVARPKVTQEEAFSLTQEQVSQFLAAAAPLRYAPALRLILMTGLRRGELLSVKWSDVNLERRELRVTGSLVRQNGSLTVSDTKTARSRRVVSLSAAAVALLKSVEATQVRERLRAANKWSDTGYVFTTDLGEPVDPRNLLRSAQMGAFKAGLPKMGAHTLRHSFATIALLNGVPIHVVSRNLGHSSIAITADIYGHLTDQASQDAAEAVSAAMGL